MRTSTRFGAASAAMTLTFVLASCGEDEGEVTPQSGGNGQAAEPGGGDTDEPGGDETDEPGGGDTEEPGGDSDPVAEGEDVPVDQFLDRMKSVDQDLALAYSVEMVMDAGGEQLTMFGDFDGRDGEPRMSMSMNFGGVPMEMIMADGNAYMSVEGVTSPGMWAQLPAEEMEEAGLAGSYDFQETFAAFDAAAEQVTMVGTDEVNGEPVEVFLVTVDAEAAFEAQGEDLGPLSPGDTIDYEIALNPEDLPVRLTFDLAGTSTELLVSNYGGDFSIEAPSEDEIEDIDMGF